MDLKAPKVKLEDVSSSSNTSSEPAASVVPRPIVFHQQPPQPPQQQQQQIQQQQQPLQQLQQTQQQQQLHTQHQQLHTQQQHQKHHIQHQHQDQKPVLVPNIKHEAKPAVSASTPASAAAKTLPTSLSHSQPVEPYDIAKLESSMGPIPNITTPPKQQRAQSQINNTDNQNHRNNSLNSDYSQEIFSSLFANQEYTQLTDLLDNNSNIGDKSPSQSSTIYNPEFQTSLQHDNNTRPFISLSDNSTNVPNSAIPNIMLSATVNGIDYTSPLIIRHTIKTPEDVYMVNIQSYNYPKAYHALLNYLKERFNKDQLIRIAETMADYRPSFIAATRSLVELDLLFAERAFQRSLLEYESMTTLSCSPTIMWRRTGEIVAVSTEFSSLTQHTKTSLLSKRTFIIELMNDSSALDYFRLFSSVAFGDLNGVIITECTLLTPTLEPIKCASTWTVKRDIFDIPMLIVGQFLPILQAR